MTREELIAKVQEVARRHGATTLSVKQFMRESGVGGTRIQTLFGAWSKLCEAAGIAAHPPRSALTDTEIFCEMRTAFLDLGGVPKLAAFERAFKYTANVFTNRGWTWKAAKTRFRAWAEAHDPTFPYMDQLPDGSAALPRVRRAVDPMTGVHAPLGARLMGDALGFGAMANAPVNEMGVLALFAMVAGRLGYSLELFNPRFPDIEARRRVLGDRWERVLIELEYRSSNFLDHGHDRKGCQVIVCWEADWRPDDIEVLDLRAAVAALQAQDAAASKERDAAASSVRDAERRRQMHENDGGPARSVEGDDNGGPADGAT